jgi:hypothetical protein
MEIWILLLQIKLLKAIFVQFTGPCDFSAVRDAASRWWYWNTSTTLHYLYVPRRLLLLHVNYFQFWNFILCAIQIRCSVLFVWIVSIFLEILDILVLLNHIYFTLIDHRNARLRLYSNFILELTLQLGWLSF